MDKTWEGIGLIVEKYNLYKLSFIAPDSVRKVCLKAMTL